MYIKGPGRGIGNSNGPEVRTHLEFAKNQMISSLESEQSRVRKKKKQLGLMMSE